MNTASLRPTQPDSMSLSNMVLSKWACNSCADFSFLAPSLCTSQQVKICIHSHSKWLHHANELVWRDQPAQLGTKPNQSILLPPRSRSRGDCPGSLFGFYLLNLHFKHLFHRISWVSLRNRRKKKKNRKHCHAARDLPGLSSGEEALEIRWRNSALSS